LDPDEFVSQQREIALSMTKDVQRVMRTDADIMEAVRDMVAAARDEVARNPRLAFEAGLVVPHARPAEPLVREDELEGGQLANPLAGIFDLVKAEKPLIQEVIRKMLGV
jgi:hypothetical protein